MRPLLIVAPLLTVLVACRLFGAPCAGRVSLNSTCSTLYNLDGVGKG
jgi:hypothetical protein